jgi:hypothetical protein
MALTIFGETRVFADWHAPHCVITCAGHYAPAELS